MPSCNPAVPPPPVSGAPFGTCDADGVAAECFGAAELCPGAAELCAGAAELCPGAAELCAGAAELCSGAALCCVAAEWLADGEAEELCVAAGEGLRSCAPGECDALAPAEGEALSDGPAVLPAGLGEAGEVLAVACGAEDPVPPAPLPDALAEGVLPLLADPPACGEWDAGALAVPLDELDDGAGVKIGGTVPDAAVHADTDAETRRVAVA
jgi:hypothetical protein